jgi:hypothetical protein
VEQRQGHTRDTQRHILIRHRRAGDGGSRHSVHGPGRVRRRRCSHCSRRQCYHERHRKEGGGGVFFSPKCGVIVSNVFRCKAASISLRGFVVGIILAAAAAVAAVAVAVSAAARDLFGRWCLVWHRKSTKFYRFVSRYFFSWFFNILLSILFQVP